MTKQINDVHLKMILDNAFVFHHQPDQKLDRQWIVNLLDEILKKIETGKKYYHILKEHPKLSKIAKFGCEMFNNMENIIALRIWQILYTFVLRVENNTQLIPFGIISHG